MIELNLALLADAANVATTGQLNILGEFNSLLCEQVPAGLAGKVLVFRLTGSAADEGPHTLSLRLVDQDRELTWAANEQPLAFPKTRLSGTPARVQAISPLPPILFPALGTYELEFLLDGKAIGGLDIHVVRREDLAPDAGG